MGCVVSKEAGDDDEPHTPLLKTNWKKLFDSPPRDPNAGPDDPKEADLDEAAQRATNDGFNLQALRNEEQKLLLFLYARRVLQHEDVQQRKGTFESLWSGTQPGKRARIDRLLALEHDKEKDTIPHDVQKFELEAWHDPETSCVFWRDRLGQTAPHQRVQKSRLCYFHAPVVLQRYLVLLHQKNQKVENFKEPGQVDMCTYIRRHFGPKDLENHIFQDAGGSTLNTAEQIMVPGTTFTDAVWSDAEQFVQLFVQFGPALIAHFMVHESFRTGPGPFLGAEAATGNQQGRHAMLAVGYRWLEPEDGGARTLRVLVQNWWADKQFVEVDLAYLHHCGARLHFADKPQDRIPAEFDTTKAVYAENEMCDMPDGYTFEGE